MEPVRLVQAIVLVSDLDAARRQMEELGFAVAAGGRHPGRGTANLIVPFGSQYLELLAVVDEAEAGSSPQGRPVLAVWSRRGPGLARWSVEVGDLDQVGSRLGLPVEARSRHRPDDVEVTWRAVGVDAAWAQPWRCAYMAWDDPATHPARLVAEHPNGASGFAGLEVTVFDESEARAWLGGEVPDSVELRVGAPAGALHLTVAGVGPTAIVF